jgi:hypothetical protein
LPADRTATKEADVVNMEWLHVFEGWLPELQELIPPALEGLTGARDDVVGVALVTDSDGRTLQPAALSRSRRDELAVEHPAHAQAYAWEPDEWDILPGLHEPSLFDPLMAKVRALSDEVDDESWLGYTVLAYNWVVEGMKNLANEGWFETVHPDAKVAFWVTDSEEPVENVIEWVQLLNPPERSAPYVAHLREHGL